MKRQLGAVLFALFAVAILLMLSDPKPETSAVLPDRPPATATQPAAARTQPTNTVVPRPATTPVGEATRAPLPPPAPIAQPDRTITGSEYRSAAEQAWFEANCVGQQPAQVSGQPAAPDSATPATTIGAAESRPGLALVAGGCDYETPESLVMRCRGVARNVTGAALDQVTAVVTFVVDGNVIATGRSPMGSMQPGGESTFALTQAHTSRFTQVQLVFVDAQGFGIMYRDDVRA